MDILSPITRKKLMASIRSKNTGPELVVRRFLFRNGIRFRLHSKKLPGRPDISISSLRVVIFINGCFWHGHRGCKYSKLPSTNTLFWQTKIRTNIERDKKAIKDLHKLGWEPIIIWTCSLKSLEKSKQSLNSLLSILQARYCFKEEKNKEKIQKSRRQERRRTGAERKRRKDRRLPPKRN